MMSGWTPITFSEDTIRVSSAGAFLCLAVAAGGRHRTRNACADVIPAVLGGVLRQAGQRHSSKQEVQYGSLK
ncbi:MAG: hypothetical protein EOS81_02820 [Mesorhizobium sp.]|uniref:hypothetical protein n=1 Tax=Mesorhizobium sp. TaxID=1871066 RepID=UPI000FE9E54D|nr:hypothetical protein [Mesorhizobium sp.]RWF05806.1 MAG: hypothetical protein EOS81_02820 [Mesorhizobium sp.]TIV58680.1 MAG: hypothetical protein E5V80_17235 [Mesorhizobium sp.]